MRYAQGVGLTAIQQVRREQVRLHAAELFARGYTDTEVTQRTAGHVDVGQPMAPGLDLCWRRGPGLQRPGLTVLAE